MTMTNMCDHSHRRTKIVSVSVEEFHKKGSLMYGG